MAEQTNKRFSIRHNIGTVRYCVSFHDGQKTHTDGSPFFDIRTFNNKRGLSAFVAELRGLGYVTDGETAEQKTKTIFRKFRDGEVIALFPELPGTLDPWTCESYMHIGQHSAASEFITENTKPARPEEFAPLLSELERIGYNVQIIERFSPAYRETRKAELNRTRG